LDLLPAVPGSRIVTPYTAPEVAAEHRPADSRSDIFAFGVVLFEMLTGRRAFEGENEAALVMSIASAPMPPSGSSAVDRLIAGCVAKDPAARWQRMQRIQPELKLLTAAAHRAASSSPRRDPAADAALRSEMQQMEERIATRLQAHEQALAEAQRSAAESIGALREQLATFQELRAHNEPDVEAIAEKVSEKLMARVDQSIGGFSVRISEFEQIASNAANAAPALETSIASLRQQLNDLHSQMATGLHEFELNIKAQASALESARTSMAQTDDLVERVVEALESLQSTVLEHCEERALALS
jgi:serine/threonine protein kinase